MPRPNLIRVRSYGLYHQNCKADLQLCRETLVQGPVEDPGLLDWQSLCEELGKRHPEQCPICGKRLICFDRSAPVRQFAHISKPSYRDGPGFAAA